MTYPPEHEQAIKDATWTLYKAGVVPPYSARDAVEFGIQFVNAPDDERDRLWVAMHGREGWGPWWTKHLDEDYHR